MSKIFPWLFRLKKRRSLSIFVLLIILIILVLFATRTSRYRSNDWAELTQIMRGLRGSEEQQLEVINPLIHMGARRDMNDYREGDVNREHGHYIVDNFAGDTSNDSLLHNGHDENVWINQHVHISNSSSTIQDPVTQNVNVSLWDPECEWVRFKQYSSPPYFLTAVLLVRIYESDKAKLTTRELKQWLQYLRFAGVEHVYIYDAWVEPSESQKEPLKKHIEEGYVTYIDWHTHNPYSIAKTQVAAYQDCIVKYGAEVTWTAAIDIDEYPFSPKDTRPGFLYRYMKHFIQYHVGISELTMQNFLFLGKPLDRELLIDRLWRRTPKPSNTLVKPIYQPKNVKANVHHNSVFKGRSQNAPHSELRMNHYWGARLQDWSEDTPEILAKTRVDKGMEPVVDTFKKCDSYLRSYIE